MSHQRKVFIVGGGGMVGANAAMSIAMKELVSEVIIIDIMEDLALGQALDINHAAAYTSSVTVRTGKYEEIADDDIIVITSGVPQKPGQSRRELAGVNAGIMRDVVGKIMAGGKKPFILVIANPVDALTHIALQASGLPKERVFGSGTSLDTARLRVALGQHLGVNHRQIDAFVLGEHGDASFPALSSASVSNVPLDKFPGFTPDLTKNIEADIRDAAYKIIEAKKATYFGIGQTVATIVEALLRPNGTVLPVCSLMTGEYGLNDVVISVPSIVSDTGVRPLDNYPLNDEEQQKMHTAADTIHDTTSGL